MGARKLVSYDKLTSELKEEIKRTFPEGLSGHVFRIPLGGKDYCNGFEFSYKDDHYLIKLNKNWKKQVGFVTTEY